ncbi:UvrD-helicase domain-containing protein [Cyclobacterium jeungdonense]|uniref:DNA 3'-5' helicase n=1 Tax=Cyclobacterium jeungdonense TaxID=708087 RepID=A0ABT8CBR0_9BACT|nr:UvrD-helicase domain-containing protein [Cyclobacterium jeungdonense]MDN3689238.1 UvrD-helicase domain-containing protein [Cyclobacterium jeungdonense]
MASPTPFHIYKSSAGSGKTYTLTTAYLKLALENPLAFRQILAVTFTNKATQEMKERIIQELKRIKNKADETQPMDRDLMARWNLKPSELSQRAAMALTAILHDYGSFSVSTIDSFFQQVIRAFAREIDLQAKYDVELDQEGIMERIVDRLLMRVVEEPDLHRWLVAFSMHKIQEGSSWDTKKLIHELGGKIFQEDFKMVQKEVRHFLDGSDNLKKLISHLYQQKQVVVRQAEGMKAEANQIRINHGLEWEDFHGGSKSFVKKLDQLGDPASPIPELTDLQKIKVKNPEEWYTKTSRKKSAIQAAYQEGLGELFSRFEPLLKTWTTLDAMTKNLYVFGLFGYLLEELEALKEEENMLLISEANDFLRSITAENEAPFIYEKVGNRFRHFLLDEFQDTSGFQWESFRPLLLNSLSMGKANLVVGDVKQSIYRWRGGEMRLLMEQVENDTGHFGLEVKNLDTNFRSLPQVVFFNNSLFSRLSRLLAASLTEELGSGMGDLISTAYAEISQKVSLKQDSKGQSGKVRLEFLEPEKPQNFSDAALEALPAMVDELISKGYRQKDIAILVRKNDQAANIADAFMAYEIPGQEKKYEVISDEALFLHKSAVVRCLLAALKLVSNPNDGLSGKNLWVQWARAKNLLLGQEFFLQGTLPEPHSGLERTFFENIHKLKKLPLMDLLEALVELLGFNGELDERAYLSGLKEAVYDFVGKNRADLGSFLEWWEQQGHKRTVKLPDTHDAIRILTIHKSKGLQFKVVLLPFLDWKIFDTAKDPIVWAPYSWDEALPPVIMPLTIRQNLLNSAFAPAYREECLLSHLDTLNMLYVAFTRAEEVIWGLVPHKESKKRNGIGKVDDLLFLALNQRGTEGELDLEAYFDSETLTLDLGNWPSSDPGVKPATDRPEIMAWKYRPWRDSLQVRQVFGDFDETGMIAKRDFGRMVHTLIEKASTRMDFSLELEALYFDGAINKHEMVLLEQQFATLCEVPEFNSWFDDRYEILTEQGILMPGGGSKRPDRLVFKKGAVEVVDFKTGKESQSHKEQVKGYMELIRQIEKGKAVTGFLCYLETGSIIRIS